MPSIRTASLAAALSLAALGGAPATAQPERREEPRYITITLPQFVVHAVSFTADDETGYDWAGSDEVHAAFADFNPVSETATSEYDHVNAGETIAFIAPDQCISPLPDCSRGRDRVRFSVALWEADANLGMSGLFGLQKPSRIGRHDMYDTGIHIGDDLIGRASVGFSRQQLLGTLPTVGHSFERQVALHGGEGSYRFNYRVTRLPDVRKRVIVGGPTREP